MKTYTLEEIHKIDLKIAKEFIRICKKNNLTYYIIGGTFLGAIRHKGFIPWDDDMDIAMPRKDFNIFINIANQELKDNYHLVNHENDEEYRYSIPRVVDLTTETVEERNNKKTHLAIDIFPIDGTPNNLILRKIYYFRILFNRMLVSWYYIDEVEKNKKRTKLEKILIALGKILPTKKMIKPKKVLKKIDVLLQKNSFEKSDNVGTIMGAYKVREIVPKEFFGKPTKYQFEDIKLYGPEKYDEYLTHMYGDYMSPPENKNENSHYAKEDKK